VDEGRDVWLLHRSGCHRQLLQLAVDAGIGHRVVSTDAVHPHAGLADDYRIADVCVQASRAEVLGFAPLEALACHVPVVATAVGGLVETIVDSDTGWMYPVRDAEALAGAIAAVLDDPAEGLRRATAGRQMVIDRYERELAFNGLDHVLAWALSSASISRCRPVPAGSASRTGEAGGAPRRRGGPVGG
jgi:glycosyltransferase involved in cell wall biosynthesis